MQRGRILLACSFLLITACSGSENEDLFGDPAVTDQKPSDPAAASGPAAPGGAAQGGGTVTSSATGSTPGQAGTPASTPPSSDPGGTKTDPPPAATCVKEIEPNGTLEKATSFTACIAGTIEASRASDFSEIVAPKTAKEILIKHEESGRVSYRVYVNGLSLPLYMPDLPTSMTAAPGATYAFEAIGEDAATWKLEISFQ